MSVIDEESFAQRQAPLRALLGHPEHFVADLHTHTTLSDGSDDFEALLGRARIRGVTHIAVTNHDTVSGLDRMARLAAERSFPFVGGVEISAWDEQRRSRVHILGLRLSSASAAIERLCAPLLARRSAASAWQAERLRAAGYRIDEDKLARLASASTGLYKQHLMAALTDDSFTSLTYQSLYRTLFKDGGICEREIVYVDARDAVEAVVSDGGLAVLAHPGQYDNFAFIDALVEAGLSGIEKYHPDHDGRHRALVDEAAARHGLFITGGSDYHGAFGKVAHPGQCALIG